MLYTERVICIINIFETLKRVLAKSSNKEDNPKTESINSNLKYNKISYVRITFIKKEMKEKAAKIPGYMLEAMNENNVDAEALLKLIPVLDDYIQKLKETE